MQLYVRALGEMSTTISFQEPSLPLSSGTENVSRWKRVTRVLGTRLHTYRRIHWCEVHSACSHVPVIEAVEAYGLFLSDNKLLASDTDVALVAPEVSQMPVFVHCSRILTSENQLRMKQKKINYSGSNMLRHFYILNPV